MQTWRRTGRPLISLPPPIRSLLRDQCRHRHAIKAPARDPGPGGPWKIFPSKIIGQKGEREPAGAWRISQAIERISPARENGQKGERSAAPKTVSATTQTRWGGFDQKVNEKLFDRDPMAIIEPALKPLTADKLSFPEDEKPAPEELERYKSKFCSSLNLPSARRTREASLIHERLRERFATRGSLGVELALRGEFEQYVRTARISPEDHQLQKKVADLRYPAEWFPISRQLQRNIHLHVGPTNSGKTYQALKRLEKAKTGVYAGPLRLLAHEVYTRMTAKGRTCALITGDDIRMPDDEKQIEIKSCTVEMIPINEDEPFEVAVIDEIQMMADISRGWAWTHGVLGLRAKEIHLCGEPRIVPLIQELAQLMGDKLEIHNYERLNPLRVMSTSLNGKLTNLRKGDCVVGFSRKQLHSLKREIEMLTGKRCAIVYGSLPPETRAAQAELFNDPNNEYDYLVASDAIGMGLNLEIKRIVFESTFKMSNGTFTRIQIPHVKQIAGRAGRFRTAAQERRGAQLTSSALQDTAPENLGLVTTLHEMDLPYIQDAMTSDSPPLVSAGIQPPAEIVKRFASYFPVSTPFKYILSRLFDLSTTQNRFFIGHNQDQLRVAEKIDHIKELTIPDRYIFTLCPFNLRDGEMGSIVVALARCIARRSGGFLDIPEIKLEVLDRPISGDKEYLGQLESLHRAIGVYCWLSFRFRAIFSNQAMAMYCKSLVERQIERALNEFSANRKVRAQLLLQRRRMKEQWLEMTKREEALDGRAQTEEVSNVQVQPEEALHGEVQAQADVEPDVPSETQEALLEDREDDTTDIELQEQASDEEDAMALDDSEESLVPKENNETVAPEESQKDERLVGNVHG